MRLAYMAALFYLEMVALLSGCGPGQSSDASDLMSRASNADVFQESPSENRSSIINEQTSAANSTAPPENLIAPNWISTALESPDVNVRLNALEAWMQSAPKGHVDPVIVGLSDPDERVRTRALALLEEDRMR